MLETWEKGYSGGFGVGASSPVPPTGSCCTLRVLSSSARRCLCSCPCARSRVSLSSFPGSKPSSIARATSHDTYRGELRNAFPASGARAHV